MTIEKLISLLQTLPPETEVTVWHDGEEHRIYEIDTLDHDSETGTVQINTVNSEYYANS